MKLKFLLFLLTTSLSIDVCVQFTTHQSCIQYQSEQCRWYGEYCRKSNDYLLGCNANIGVKLCVKQFGTLDGEVAECIFDKYCHTIYDKHTIHCTDQLSKSGCLSITNPNEFCKWENGQCQNLKVVELNQIQDTFDQKLLSASVCSQINGFLIIHNSVLWGLIGYKPDLFKEAENLAKIEAGIEVDTTTSYDQTAQLQDNYIDKNGKFQWYSTTTQLTISNGRINDYTRYGCIAQEILTDSRFLTLFSLSGIIRGVNHVYCSYLPVHPTSPSLAVFINNECIPITQLQLKKQKVIEKLNIQCSNLSRIPCQLYYNQNEKCKINVDSEYECQTVNAIEEQAICSSNPKEDTHYSCVNSKSNTTYCYLQVSLFSANCSSSCSNLSTSSLCLSGNNCSWLLEGLDSPGISDYRFKACVPIGKCNQEGLNELYCKKMAANCYWKDDETRCVSIDRIEQFNCSNCNQMYCCSSVVRYDQFCIWKSNENLCLNVKDQQLFSHFQSFPTNVIMNKNLCVYQIGQYNYYNEVSRTCETKLIDLYKLCIDYNADDLDVDEVDCNNPPNDTINKDGCLALLNSFTKWNYFTQKCQYIVNRNKPCDEMKVVNPNVCQYAQVATRIICLYNLETQSCYSADENEPLICDTPGIKEELCLNLTEQTCQWSDNKCQSLKLTEIKQRNCQELIKVTPTVCKYPIKQQCIYDDGAKSCVIFYDSQNSCEQYSNKYACQATSILCYFNNFLNQCEISESFLNTSLCKTEFISKKTCLSITTPGQRCEWNDGCKDYTQQFYSDCYDKNKFKEQYNLNVCTALSSNIFLDLTDYQYCRVTGNEDNQECSSSTSTINDCGETQMMNIYSCMGYTTEQCYFQNYKCKSLDKQAEYQDLLLTQLTCDQSNMQICNLILTSGQACFKVNKRKCILLYKSFSETCANLKEYDMTVYGPNLCIRANDKCYYDSMTRICSSESKDLFDCTKTGASKLLCLQQTKGACVFTSNYCQLLFDTNIACEFRNKKACTLGNLNCQWNEINKVCNLSMEICPSSYQNGSNWPVCAIGNDDCYSGQNGCLKDSAKNLPCWLSLNQSLCERQQTFCQWIDNKCQYKQYKCEDALTLNECIFHKSLNCVYDNNQCIEVLEIQDHQCDEFQFTSFNFCRQFYPNCTYFRENFTCSRVNFFGKSKQMDTQFIQFRCRTPYTEFSDINICLFQKIKPCTLDPIIENKCQNDYDKIVLNRRNCEYWNEEKLPSILMCESVPLCRFAMSLYGIPFCHPIPLTCESISSNLCLREIADIKCYITHIDGMVICNTFQGEITCDSIAGLKVNLWLCLEASKNSQQGCFYQASQNLCKKVIATDKDVALQNCAQEPGQKFYDLKQQQCVAFDNKINYDDIYFCFQLNQKSCTSSDNQCSCVYIDSLCQEQQINDQETECFQKNHKACLNANKDCIWDVELTSCADESSSTCNICEYSEYHCIRYNKLWDGKQCYIFEGNLPASFFRCSNLGLNRALCLNNTIDLYCFWNGIKCKEGNLKILKCTDAVSKSTCLHIKTYGQICKWLDDQCISVADSQNCSDYLTLQNCRYSKLSCEYNQGQNQCQEKKNNLQLCSSTLSYGACKQVKYSLCQWSENQCQEWERKRFSCGNIINQWGCMNTIMFCKWEADKCLDIETDDYEQPQVPCFEIPENFNQVSCSKYSIEPCRYDEDLKRCIINLTSDFLYSLTMDQSNYIQIRLIYECSEFTNINDCIGSRIGYCEWNDGQCLNCEQNQNCSNEGCYNKSLKQCLSISNQFCAWRNDSCVEWIINPEANLQELTLVTEKCCSILNKDIKYEHDLKSCVSIDYEFDDCSTPGLSKYACLRLIKFECIYANDECKEFNLGAKDKCEQYQNVTQAVCQNLQNLSCKYDSQNHKCVGLQDSDTCNTLGLSILGCSNIKSTPCYWNDDSGSCQDFIVDPGQNQCDDVTKRNSLSCSLLNYHLDVCSFNIEKRTCHQKFNPNSQCSSPGLNQLACVSLKVEPCIYKNNQCSKISNLYVSCNEMKIVNEISCKLNQLDYCLYDPIYHYCVFTNQVLPCNYWGLNKHSCASQTVCHWSYDNSQCVCKTEQSSQKCQLEIIECKNTPLCYYDIVNQYCKLKTCNNLTKCEGSINGYLCYLNQEQHCQNAKRCEDIINLDQNIKCSDFVFNFQNCITLLDNCVSSANLEKICPNSDCSNTSCKLDNFVCRPLQCSDYIESECFQYQNCTFLNSQCQHIENCSEIKNQINCVRTTVGNKRCSWEMYGIFENSKHCTNTYCHLYMASPSLCNGNEINQYSCFMDQFLQCRQCEEIVDRCTCENSNGACVYTKGLCRSILCQSFLNVNDCVESKKCYWSSVDKVCRKFCKQLILQENCDALSYECHWNPYQYQCEQGVEVIPDLNIKVDIQQVGDLLLGLVLLVYFLD